jgi:chromosome segregation ATPase
MTEIEVLDRDIQGLKQLLHLAWEDLANKSFTPYEYREKRNEMDRCAAELRDSLKAIEAERQRAREQVQERGTLQARKVSLRLLG